MFLFLSIFFGFIAFIFIFHFISLYFVRQYRKRHNYNDRLLKTSRVEISLTSNSSLMIDLHHHILYNVDDDKNKFAKTIIFFIGGFCISISYGHNFLNDNDLNDDCCTKYYGLYAIDNELFWKCIWWGKRLYDNPLRRNKFILCQYFDFNANQFVCRYKGQEDLFRTRPHVLILNDTVYINKAGKEQNVKQIIWTFEERQYVNPILDFLKIGQLFTKCIVELSFDSNTGLGVNNDSWKGGVYGSSIKLNKKTNADLYKLYLKATREQPHLITKLKHETIKRINQFMLEDRLY